jgi:hypothetical protein
MAINSAVASGSRHRDAVRWAGVALGAGLTVVGLVLLCRGVYDAFPFVGGFGDDSDGPLIRERGRHEIASSLPVLLVAVGFYAWARAWTAAICTGIALAIAGLLEATTPTSSNLFYVGLLPIAALCVGGVVVDLRSTAGSRGTQ